MDFNSFIRNENISRECSQKMNKYLMKDILPISRVGRYLLDGTIRFVNPNEPPNTCFRLQIGDETEISIAMATDRMGNRARFGEVYLNEGTQYKGNPTTVEIMIMKSPSSYYADLDYNGDIRSFCRDDCPLEGGYSDFVEELQRIHDIVIPISEELVNSN